jgi:hypothetical protein
VNYIVAVNGRPGSTVSPLELFSRLSPRWTWVRDCGRPDHGGAAQPAEGDAESTMGMCITDDRTLMRLSSELAKMPGAGVYSVRVYPLKAS